MIIRLQHQRSDGDMDTYHLKSGRRYHIGRGSGCEVRILDLKLSRKHCALEYSEGEWRVIDLASTNGCKVDGDQIVGSMPLKTGTAIEIGQSVLRVARILGDDEDGDGDDDHAHHEHAAGDTDTHRVDPVEMQPTTDSGIEQEPLPSGEHDPAARSDHDANDWEPEPEPELATKTGALLPNAASPGTDAKADRALEAARRAAERSIESPGSLTGQLQKPSLSSRDSAAPGANANAKKPSPTRPATPLPSTASDLGSGPYTSLDRNGEPSPRLLDTPRPRETPAVAAAQPEAKQPGTETRRRQKIMPIIVQPMSDDEAPATPVAPTPAPVRPPPSAIAAPAPAPKPQVDLEQTSPTFPVRSTPRPAASAPVAPAPAPAAPAIPAAAAAGDERTFFITVLGRRVGPLTRMVARDLKARELKGTLTLKDLEPYK